MTFDLSPDDVLNLRSIEDAQCESIHELIGLAIIATKFTEIYNFNDIADYDTLCDISGGIMDADQAIFLENLAEIGDPELTEKMGDLVEWVVGAHC